ncbi:unnamed protein product, partial [Closterium sp. NIES-65]
LSFHSAMLPLPWPPYCVSAAPLIFSPLQAWCFDLARAFDPAVAHSYCWDTSPTFAVADVWTEMRYQGSTLEYDQDAHRALLADWVKAARGTPHMIDYTTKGILQAAVQNCEYWRLIDPQGRPPGLIGLLPGKAVTFVDNHSTGSTQQHLMPSHPARSLPPVHASFPPGPTPGSHAVTFVDNHSTGSTQQHLMPPHPARSLRPAHASFPPGPTPGSHVRGQSLHGLHTAALAIPRLGGHSGVRGEGTWEGRGQGWDRYSEAEMREGRLGHEDNHSTGSSQQRWPFPSWEVTLGYVYILTHPGVPCVFIDHLYEWNLKDPIQKLLVIRQRNGITSRSAIRIMTCSTQLYVARIGTNVDDDRLFRGVVVKLGPSFDMHGTAPGT